MRRNLPSRLPFFGVASILTLGMALGGLFARTAQAACDVIPGELSVFPGALGETNTPYAAPDQLIQLRVRPMVCDESSVGLGDPDPALGGCTLPEDLRATVLFFDQSLGSEEPRAVVIARDCGLATDPTSAAFAAENLAGVSGAECRSVAANALDVVEVPVTGGAECRLNFRLPATPNPALEPDFTLSGPARIFVDNGGAPLPTLLSSTRCADLSSDEQIACIDELYPLDGTCDRSASNRGDVFSHFVALPRPNVYADMISADPATRPTVRFALDDRGNVLANMNWEGVLFDGGSSEVFPPPQLVNFFAEIGSGQPGPPPGEILSAPEHNVWSSYNKQGIRLPPLFEPRPDRTESVTLFGSTDALLSVIRVERLAGQCVDDGEACLTDSGCGTSSCDLSSLQPLFDLRYCISPEGCVPPGDSPEAPTDPAASGPGGPGVILAANYSAEIDGFVPLENLNVCRNVDDLNCLLRDEGLPVRFDDASSDLLSTEQECLVDPNSEDGRRPLCSDRNEDLDILDTTLTLREARSGQKLSLPPSGAEGTAVATINEAVPPEGPFGLPFDSRSSRNALASGPSASGEGCVAILLAEPDEAGIDANADGDVFDPLLRVYCSDGNGGVIQTAVGPAEPPGAAEKLAVLADPKVLGAGRTLSPLQAGLEPMVVAGGKVVFLLDEPGNAETLGERADVLDISLGGGPSPGSSGRSAIDDSGSVVCFESTAQLVDSRDKNKAGPDVYCHDFETGETFVGNRFQEPPQRRALCEGRIIRANADAQRPSVVGSGERVRVCYDSPATNLSKGDQNKARDVFLLDRCSCETLMVSVEDDGSQFADDSFSCELAGNGESVVFESNGQIFSQGIAGSVPESCGVGPDESNPLHTTGLALVSERALGVASAPTTSDDGLVAFQVVDDDGFSAIYLSDGSEADAECLDVDGTDGCDVARNPHLSRDGRLLTYEAFDPRAGADGVFVLDRVTGLTEAVGERNGASSDGEAVASAAVFTSDAVPSVMLRDRVTLLAKTIEEGHEPSLSADGRTLAYTRDEGVYRATPNLLDPSADADDDGFSDSSVLAVLDLDGGGLSVIGRAAQVAVGDSTIAYLDPNGLVYVVGLGEPDPLPLKLLDGSPVVASAVAASDDTVCVLAAADGALLCASAGSTSLAEFRDPVDGLVVQADGLAVQGDLVVALGKPSSPRTLWIFGADGGYRQSVPGVRRFRVSTNQYVAADQCEPDLPDLENNLNGDGDQDDCVAIMIAPDGTVFDTANSQLGRPRMTVVPCTGDVCDDTDPFKIFPFGTDGSLAKMRLLSLESQEPALVADLNGDGDADDVVVREVAFFTEIPFLPYGVPEGSTGNVLAGIESGPGGSQGGAALPALLGVCNDGYADTNISCQSDANCTAQGACGGPDCCTDIQPKVLALSDLDGDGVFDVYDNCPSLFNPEQDGADSDGDGTVNTCDELSCGDGIVQPREYCDYADTTIDPLTGQTLGSFCNAPEDAGPNCTPLVLLDVSESAVNPDQQGVLPTNILGSPVLNLATTASGDRPAKMLDPGSLVLEGLQAGENCGGPGASSDDDLTDPGTYASRLTDANGDGILDLALRFRVPDMDLSPADVESCLTGSFDNASGRFFDADFESRDDLNVK